MRRCILFVPGNNPRNLQGGDLYGADALVLDLEDAVVPTEKDSARVLVRNALEEMAYRSEIIVRINGIHTPYWSQDLQAVLPKGVKTIMLPKTGSPADIKKASEAIGQLEASLGIPQGSVHIIPLLESVRGIEVAVDIACADARIDAIYLGAEDLAFDLGARRTRGGEEILLSRAKVVAAARIAGIHALDTPFLDIREEEGLRRDCVIARNLGFDGKAAVYPLQVAVINSVFTPTSEEYLDARRLLEAAEGGTGIATYNGRLVDGPVAAMARRTVEQYEGGVSG